MVADNNALTTVIDAGARYGAHPTWQKFDGEMIYFAFEPDKKEAERLKSVISVEKFEIIDHALSSSEGKRKFHITKHRGYCSFLEPDNDCIWFRSFRPGESEIESVINVQTVTIDGFAEKRGCKIDFLKIDTEGAELDVIKGAGKQLAENVIGIRAETFFQQCYKGQALFPDLHNFLMEKGFYILNMDYFGRGVPSADFFRNPNPLDIDMDRYGTLFSADGVWLKNPEMIFSNKKISMAETVAAVLKYAYFCMLNNAPDVGLKILRDAVINYGISFDKDIEKTKLYLGLRKACATYLGRWRVRPDSNWLKAREMFKTIFNIELEGGHKFWEIYQTL